MHTSLKSELQLHAGESISETLGPSETRLYRLYVPPNKNMRSVSISLTIGAMNISAVRMFVSIDNDGKTLPSSSNTMRVMPTWVGLMAKAYDTDPAWFCQNCTYKALISSKIDTAYTLSFHTSDIAVEIKDETAEIYDTVQAGDRSCYVYRVKSASESLQLNLNPFGGNPDLYVNPRELLQDLSKFTFNSTGELGESMVIGSGQRANVGLTTGDYYICVVGASQASYGLTVTMQPERGTKLFPISCGLTQTMYVDQNELILFDYHIRADEPTNLTFTLVSINGNADLYVKYCNSRHSHRASDDRSCDLTRDELYSPQLLKSTNVSSVDIITTVTNPAACTGESKSCSYLMGVLGVQDSLFSISVTCSGQVQQPLAEGIPHVGWVDTAQNRYFSFVVYDPTVQSVKVQLTSLSGDADLAVSRSNPYCDANNADYSSTLDYYIPDTVVYSRDRDSFLNSTYHVTVHGSTSAMFSITYTVTTRTNKLPSAIMLYDGSPQLGAINGTESGVLYKFSVSFPSNGQHDIKVTISAVAGTFSAYIGVDYVPTPTNHTWELHNYDSSANIRTADPMYRACGTYYLLVTKAHSEDATPLAFSAKYITGQYLTTLMEGFPEVGNLTGEGVDYYEYNVWNMGESTITITVTPLSGDPDLYISVNSTNRLPSGDASDYHSAAFGADSIQIPTADLQRKNPRCSSNADVSACVLYIAVLCSSDECSYSLQVNEAGKHEATLIDGLPQFGVARPEKPQLYLMTPDIAYNDTNTVITVYPRVGRVKVYVLLVPAATIAARAEGPKEIPGPTKYDIVSTDRANSQVAVVEKEDLKKCGSRACQFSIGVYFDDSAEVSIMPIDPRSEFTITATSSLLRLIDGQPIIDFVPSKGYKYYIIRVSCVQCTLSIALSPLSDGDPDLYVNKGAYKLPTTEASDFVSASYRGEFLQILPTDPFFKSGQLIRGEYTIGVYGAQNCTYTLTATTTASQIKGLLQGIPVRHEQAASEVSYFSFESWKGTDIRVALSMTYGRTVIRATVVGSLREHGILNRLPSNEQKSLWSSQSKNTNGYLAISRFDSGFIANGTYIIAVEALEAASYDISVEYISDKDYKLLKNGETVRDRVGIGESVKYAFVSSNYVDITFQLATLSGGIQGRVQTNVTEPTSGWRMAGNSRITITASDPGFILGMYYVTIRGEEASEFTLSAEQRVQAIKLSEGLPYTGSLANNAPQYFIYSTRGIKKGLQGVRLTIYAKFDLPVIDATVLVREVSRQDRTMPTRSNRDYEIVYNHELSQLSGSIDVSERAGKELAISVEGAFADYAGKPTKYTMVAWSTGIALMTPGTKYTNAFQTPGEMHTYELVPSREGIVRVEAAPCRGEIEFFVTPSIVAIQDRKYDIKRTELSKGRLFGYFEAKKQTYYITVRGVASEQGRQGKSGTDIWYTVSASVSESQNADDVDPYVIENYGTIVATQEPDRIVLRWGRIYLKDSRRSPAANVKFSVYVAKEGEMNMFTPCGITMGGAKKLANGISEASFSYVPSADQQFGEKLVFNVLAQIPEQGQTIAYMPVTVQAFRPGRRGWIFGGMICGVTKRVAILLALLLGLAGAALYYCRKYRQVEAKYQYEMSDVTRMVRRDNQTNYSQLMGQTQETIQ